VADVLNIRNKALIQVYDGPASVASLCPPEEALSTFRTAVAGLFVQYPLLCSYLTPVRNSAKNDLFAYGHGELFDKPTREFSALVTSLVSP
jgi:hypothetical protein